MENNEKGIEHLIPESWLNSTVWLSAYRTHGLADEDVSEPPIILDLRSLGARLVRLRCRLQFPARDLRVEWKPSGGLIVEESKAFELRASQGWHILFFANLDETRDIGLGGVEGESSAIAESMVAVVCGRRAIFERVCNQDVSPRPGPRIHMVKSIEIPFSIPAPEFSADRLGELTKMDNHLEGLSTAARNRVLISLRWFRMGFAGPEVDSVLKYWVAIETLAMPGSNIKPVNEMLASAYGLTFDEVKDRFRVGRIQGLRSAIVHHGLISKALGPAKRYMEALYIDLVYGFFQLPSRKAAEAYLASSEAALDKCLHSSSVEKATS